MTVKSINSPPTLPEGPLPSINSGIGDGLNGFPDGPDDAPFPEVTEVGFLNKLPTGLSTFPPAYNATVV